MSTLKNTALVIVGAIILVIGVIVWKYATTTMTDFVESAWCSTIEKTEVCQFRGYQHFLIWTTLGIINLLILGFLLDRMRERFKW